MSKSVQANYEKALRLFLLTKYTPAATQCVKTLQQLPAESTPEFEGVRYSAYMLYLNIAATLITQGKTTHHTAQALSLSPSSVQSYEQFVHGVWQFLVSGYGVAGYVDPRLVLACFTMTLKLKVAPVGRQVAEQWYATLDDGTIEYLSSSPRENDNDVYADACLKAIETYATQILPAMNDYESALSFVQYNAILDDDRKEALQSQIQQLQADAQRERQAKLEQKKRAAEQQQRQRELEEKRRQEEKTRQLAQAEAKKQEEAEASRFANVSESSASSSNSSSSTSMMTPSTTPGGSSSSSSSSRNSGSTESKREVIHRAPRSMATSMDQNLEAVKSWLRQLYTTSTAASFTFLLVVFAFLGLMRGFRGRLSQPLKTILSKLWQTAQMGTKVTYL